MLTNAPLPSWVDLFFALFMPPLDLSKVVGPWCRSGETAGLLSRSGWSLALIASWRKRLVKDDAKPCVWLPDYFCNASLGPLRHSGVDLLFYPVDETLAPNYQACRTLAKNSPPSVFVIVHFMGRPVTVSPAREICAQYGSWLVEDAAHVLRPVEGVGSHGDFVLYSPHKHLPMPDGAVLVVRDNGPGKLSAQGSEILGGRASWSDQIGHLEGVAGLVASGFLSHYHIWLLKRTLQKFGVGRKGLTATEPTELYNGWDGVVAMPVGPKPSLLARRLLSRLGRTLPDVAIRRHRRQLLWDDVLLTCSTGSSGLAPVLRPRWREWTPYMVCFEADPTLAVKALTALQLMGAPVTIWPDLPPEILADRDAHSVAITLRDRRIYLAVHQTIPFRQLIRCIDPQMALWNSGVVLPPVESGSEHSHEAEIRLEWNDSSREQWHDLLVSAGQSNLLQSWAYGDAKAAAEGWRVQRGVFRKGEDVIAVVQTLDKHFLGMGCVTRVNRGPLFLACTTESDRNSVITTIAAWGSLFKRRQIIFWAPELPLVGKSLSFLSRLGVRVRESRGWESIWVDLRHDLEALRSAMNGKWRNMLVAAEKNELEVEASTDPSLFSWMMERHEENMQEKSFKGIPVTLLQSIRDNAGIDSPLIVVRACHNGTPVGGICVACHGSSATYLIGWNGQEGRRLKANQFLLWQAIVYLKRYNIDWFDLGGIDEEGNPGISDFKKGVGGTEYKLLGETWKF